jgi:hypothetical protein
VTAVAGKKIRIVNEVGIGFQGENTQNTIELDVTDNSVVSVDGGVVTIDPEVQLDLANAYHIQIDEGAFTNTAGLSSEAVSDPDLINFRTVTPGAFNPGTAAMSQLMDTSGELIAGSKWLDIEFIGSPSASVGSNVDLANGSFVLVAKDYDPAGADSSEGYDGIQTGNFYVNALSFGQDDLIYIDNQFDTVNDLAELLIINDGKVPSAVRFSGKDLGGYVDITLEDPSSGVFGSVDAFQSLLTTIEPPIVSY